MKAGWDVKVRAFRVLRKLGCPVLRGQWGGPCPTRALQGFTDAGNCGFCRSVLCIRMKTWLLLLFLLPLAQISAQNLTLRFEESSGEFTVREGEATVLTFSAKADASTHVFDAEFNCHRGLGVCREPNVEAKQRAGAGCGGKRGFVGGGLRNPGPKRGCSAHRPPNVENHPRSLGIELGARRRLGTFTSIAGWRCGTLRGRSSIPRGNAEIARMAAGRSGSMRRRPRGGTWHCSIIRKIPDFQVFGEKWRTAWLGTSIWA